MATSRAREVEETLAASLEQPRDVAVSASHRPATTGTPIGPRLVRVIRGGRLIFVDRYEEDSAKVSVRETFTSQFRRGLVTSSVSV